MKLEEAVVLVGGLGTRLQSVLADRPKALAPIRGRPILSYVLDMLAEADVRRVVLCTGKFAGQVEDAFGARYKSMELAYSRETEPLGTGGAIVKAAPLFRERRILALNGDSYCEFLVPALARFHETARASATILLTRVDDAGRFGAVETDDTGRVTRWLEKEQQTATGPGWINAGVYVIETDLLRLPAYAAIRSLERDLFPSLIGNGLYAAPLGGKFIDIGTPESLRDAERFFEGR